MNIKITGLIAIGAAMLALAVVAMSSSVQPVFAPSPCGGCGPANVFAPGQLATNPGGASNINPGSIQSVQQSPALGQLRDCTTCGGGYWGSVPGNERTIPTGPGP